MWNFYIPVALLSSCGMLNDKGSGQTVELHFAVEEKLMITKPSKTPVLCRSGSTLIATNCVHYRGVNARLFLSS